MNLRHELLLAWAALVVVQVLTLAGAVGLLARMTPAIGGIMEDNEFSIQAVETMLVEVGSQQDDPGARERFEQALAAAHANVTEDDEPAQLQRIDDAYASAFEGDRAAREQVTAALQSLSQINRRAMGEASARASAVGRTGAWAAAVLGLLSLASAVGVGRRLERRVVEPAEAAAAAVRAMQEGDEHRRCPTRGPTELATLAQGIEALRRRPPPVAVAPDPRHDERRLLLALLDHEPGRVFLVSDRGQLLHANAEGTAALLDDPELAERLHDVGGALAEGWTRTRIDDGVSLVRIASNKGPEGDHDASRPA